DPQGDFSIQMIPRADHAGHFKAMLQVIDRSKLHAPSEPFTLCLSVDPATPVPDKKVKLMSADGHLHGPARPLRIEQSYRGAVRELRLRLPEIDSAIAARKLYLIAPETDNLRNLAKLLTPLANCSLSGVPADQVDQISAGSHFVDQRAGELGRSADWND